MDTKRHSKNFIEIFMLTALICIIFFILLLIKGVYPFGDNAFIFVDDGYQQNLATIYYIWDVLHGKRALMFDYNIAFGSNMAGMVSHFGMLSPINLLYLFIPREYIIESTVWTLLLRLILAALSMRVLIRYLIKKYVDIEVLESRINRYIISGVVIFISVSYVYSNWALRYYSFFQWIDEMIILPICIWSLLWIFEEDGRRDNRARCTYVLSFALAMIINIQQAFGITLFLIVFSGCYLFFADRSFDSLERREKILQLGFYSLIAAMIGCIILLPAAYQITHAARLGDGNIIYKVKQIFRSNNNPDATYIAEKLSIFKSLYLPLLITSVGLLYRRIKRCKVSRRIIGSLVLVIICLCPVFIESIHYIWQGGTYVCFPLRCAETMVLTVYYCMVLVSISVFREVLCSKKGQVICLIGVYIFIAVSICTTMGYVSKTMEVGDFVHEDDMYHYGQILYDEVSEGSGINSFVRYKNEMIHPNSTLVMDLASNANYMHLMTEDMIRTNLLLGYKQYYTKLSDEGGTLFTDMLLGYDYLLRKQGIECVFADTVAVYEDMEIDRYQYNAPIGFFMDSNPDIISLYDSGSSLFDLQNVIYSNMVDGEELFTELDVVDNSCDIASLDDGRYVLYLYIDYDETVDRNAVRTNISINDEILEYAYGMISLPNISEDALIVADTNCGRLHVAMMDLDLFEDWIRSMNASSPIDEDSVTYTLSSLKFNLESASSSDKLLYLPISHFDGWRCSLDGRNVDIQDALGCYIGIVIPAGFAGEVELSFVSPWRVPGFICFIIALVILVLDMRFQIVERLGRCTILSKVVSWIYCCILFGIIMAYVLNIMFIVWYRLLGILRP